jgi:hypothetical protein
VVTLPGENDPVAWKSAIFGNLKLPCYGSSTPL